MSIIQRAKDVVRPTLNQVLIDVMLNRLRTHQATHNHSAILIATPIHGNLGDQAIVLSQCEFLLNNFPDFAVFEIHRFQYELAREEIAALVRPDDLIVIDGGGNVGTLWPEETDKMNDIVRRFACNPVVVFPQTAYFSDTEEGRECERRTAEAYASNPRLVFFSRDRTTYNKVRSMSPGTTNLLVPDIVLYHDATSHVARAGALLCLRADKERVIADGGAAALKDVLGRHGLAVRETSTVLHDKRVGKRKREKVLAAKWAEFGSTKVVVTDRLHGMIFSAITGTPCVALDNVSRKVSQGYEWIKGVPNIRVATGIGDVPDLIDEVLAAGPCAYARVPLATYHEAMKETIGGALN